MLSPSSPSRRTIRRCHAVVVLVLWLLGVEVLPGLHLAAHGDDHTHTAQGLTILVTHADDEAGVHAPAHAHADGAIHADHGGPVSPTTSDHARRNRPDDPASPPVIEHVPPHHAVAGVLHHALALHRPAPPPAAPAVAICPLPSTAWWYAGACVVTPAARPASRGPPLAA
jgi:hypothetical protein